MCGRAQDENLPERSWVNRENHKQCLKGLPSNLAGTMCERDLSDVCIYALHVFVCNSAQRPE